jgi:type I restriction enzyme M protein
VRWKYGVPPKGNANFAWVQHFIHHLAPTGMAGFVLANGSMSSNQSGEGDIRKAIIEADLVDCMVALPGPALLQHADSRLPLVPRPKEQERRQTPRPPQADPLHRRPQARHPHRPRPPRTDRRRHRQDRLHLPRLARRKGAGKYEDVAGFCKSATTAEIAAHGHVLTPGRYVGAEEVEDDGEPFEEKMRCHT